MPHHVHCLVAVIQYYLHRARLQNLSQGTLYSILYYLYQIYLL